MLGLGYASGLALLILKGKDQVKLINNYLSAVAGCVWLRVAIRD